MTDKIYAEAYAQHVAFLDDLFTLSNISLTMPVLRVYDLSAELHRMKEAVERSIETKKNDSSIKIVDAIVAGRHVNKPEEDKHCDTKPKHWSVLDDVKFDFCRDVAHCHDNDEETNKVLDETVLRDSLSHLMVEILKPNTPRLDVYRKVYLFFLRSLYKAGWLSSNDKTFVQICRFSQEYPTVFGLALLMKYRQSGSAYSLFGYHDSLTPRIRSMVFNSIVNYVYHVVDPYDVAGLLSCMPEIELTYDHNFRFQRYHGENTSFLLSTFVGGMVRTLVEIVTTPNVVGEYDRYGENSVRAVDLLNILDYDVWMEETDKYQQQ